MPGKTEELELLQLEGGAVSTQSLAPLGPTNMDFSFLLAAASLGGNSFAASPLGFALSFGCREVA